MNNQHHLRTEDLHLSYGTNHVLRGVGLEVQRGNIVGLIGPNGAGKTSLLNIISGILKPQKGKVYLEGDDIRELGPKDRATRVAMVPQDPAVPQGFTALEVVLMGRNPHLGLLQWEGPGDLALCRRVMELTSTWDFSQRLIAFLSGGERQRVFIARALAQEAQLLLLDEPTANLDIQHQLKVMEIMGDLARQGLTVLAAMHDLSLAARFCNRLVLLHGGQVLADGSPEEVLTAEYLERAFAIEAVVYRDPVTNALTVGALGPIAEKRAQSDPSSAAGRSG